MYRDIHVHVQCNYKYTCDIRWVLSSDLNLVILWQDLSLVGRWFQSLRATTENDLSPQVRFEVGSFRSDMLLERKLRDGSVDLDLWTISIHVHVHISLKTILCETGSQCSSFKIGVILHDFLDKVTTRAAVFCMCWRQDIWYCGRP